jgi:hypothetical protein
MFDDKVKVDAVYGISDEPMSAEEWKTQAVWVGALAARLPGRRPAGARGAYLMGVAELHGRASHQDEHIRAGRVRPLAVTTAARSDVRLRRCAKFTPAAPSPAKKPLESVTVVFPGADGVMNPLTAIAAVAPKPAASAFAPVAVGKAKALVLFPTIGKFLPNSVATF